jgi:hypothetical protein
LERKTNAKRRISDWERFLKLWKIVIKGIELLDCAEEHHADRMEGLIYLPYKVLS